MKRAVILSPHCDDACFSLGGTIACLLDAGIELTIINVFSVSDFVEKRFVALDRGCVNAEQVTRVRKREDMDFVELMGGGIHLRYLDMSDAPMRNHDLANIEVSEGCYCGLDTKCIDAICAMFENFSLEQYDDIYCPLGIGRHVDHLLVRDSVLAYSNSNRLPSLLFYEDIPYVCRIDEGYDIRRYEKLFGLRLDGVSKDIDHFCVLKMRSMLCYESQFNVEDYAAMLRYLVRTGYRENCWEASFVNSK